jgi:hypoxanthine phosphoribosyltransferase
VAELQRSQFIKAVITLDEVELGRAMQAVWNQVAQRGPAPDAIVGIATGGLLCAQKLRQSVNVPVFSCAMRRPGTVAKHNPALRAVLRALPYAISNWVRRFEDSYLANRAAKAAQTNRPPSAQLLADVAAVGTAVSAQSLRHLLVIDDAVDSGATLACVIGALRAALPADIAITTAVISQTRPNAAFYPDVMLFRETLCRFPWSLDFRGA